MRAAATAAADRGVLTKSPRRRIGNDHTALQLVQNALTEASKKAQPAVGVTVVPGSAQKRKPDDATAPDAPTSDSKRAKNEGVTGARPVGHLRCERLTTVAARSGNSCGFCGERGHTQRSCTAKRAVGIQLNSATYGVLLNNLPSVERTEEAVDMNDLIKQLRMHSIHHVRVLSRVARRSGALASVMGTEAVIIEAFGDQNVTQPVASPTGGATAFVVTRSSLDFWSGQGESPRRLVFVRDAR